MDSPYTNSCSVFISFFQGQHQRGKKTDCSQGAKSRGEQQLENIEIMLDFRKNAWQMNLGPCDQEIVEKTFVLFVKSPPTNLWRPKGELSYIPNLDEM